MQAKSIPLDVQKRLLDDNLFPRQRIEKLFPILVGAKWAEAIKTASELDGKDYSSTVDFYIEASEKRNILLHLGNIWAIPKDLSKKCFENTGPLLKLFIAFHNSYLAKPVG